MHRQRSLAGALTAYAGEGEIFAVGLLYGTASGRGGTDGVGLPWYVERRSRVVGDFVRFPEWIDTCMGWP